MTTAQGVAEPSVAVPTATGSRAQRFRRFTAPAILSLVLVVPPLLVSSYWQYTLATAVVYAIAALSVNILLGQAGMIGLFTASFMGVGAYVAAATENSTHSWVLALLAAIGATAALGALVGLPASRIRGLTFGILTFAMALAINTLVFSEGFLGISPASGASLQRPDIPGIDLVSDLHFYYFVLVIGAIVWLVIALHQRSRAGRGWRAIRDNELAAIVSGCRVGILKIWASALAAGVAGVAGVLLLSLLTAANSDAFSPFQSLLVFAAAVTAGTGSLAGAVMAGGLLIVLPQLLDEIHVSDRIVPLLFAAGVLLAMRSRDGLVGFRIGDLRPRPQQER